MRWERFWEAYEAAPLDGRLAMARGRLTEEPDVDGGLIFELLNGLIEPLQAAGRVREVEALLSEVEARHPAAADEEAGWFAMWRAEDALITGGNPLPPMRAWAERAPVIIDMFHRMLEGLMFHGRLGDLAEVLPVAWPRIEASDDVMPHALDAYGTLGMTVALHRHLDERTDLEPLDAALRADLAPYGDASPGWIERFLAIDSGRRTPAWSPADVVGDADDAVAALDALTMAFGRALRVRWSWPRTRAELARTALLDALLDRRDALVSRTPSSGSKPKRPPVGGSARPKPPAWPIAALLVPPPEVLAEAVGQNFDTFGTRVYRGAALLAALPAWLTFIAEVEPEVADAARARRAEFGTRVAPLAATFTQIVYDPAVGDAIEHAWALADRDPQAG